MFLPKWPYVVQKGGDSFLIAVFSVFVKKRLFINFIKLLCGQTLVELVFFGFNWVFPNMFKEDLFILRGCFVGKKRMEFYSVVHILFNVEGENSYTYRDGSLDVEKLKYSFVYKLWSWNRTILGGETHSLIGFLEWMVLLKGGEVFPLFGCLYTTCLPFSCFVYQ